MSKLVAKDRVALKYGKFNRRGTVLEVSGLRATVRLDPLPEEGKPETVVIRLSLLTKVDVVDGIAELDR